MMRTAILLAAALAFGVVSPASTAGQEQVVIVVVGAPGTEEYATQFTTWAGVWEQACAKSNATFLTIGLDEDENLSDQARLEKMLTEQTPQDAAPLWLVLIGHGTFDGRTAKFNLRGPDISVDDLAGWLKPIQRPVAIINTASSSAPFLKALSAPGRVVLTATKSGFEQNYTRFGQYLAEAIIEPEADLDKDGQTSLLEAFLIASHRVGEFYSASGRLATEHALLDDNGDTLGTPADWFRGIRPVQRASNNASLDGYRAHQLHLRYSEAEARIPSNLRAKRNQLELEVMTLRDAKAQLPEDAYFSKLEALLLEMARLYETIDEPNGM
jgi:hypothetical protein